jgi:hypothetical protein
MPQNCKISQRRLLLDQLCTPGFRSMPPTESKRCRPPIPISRKKWTPCRRNWWSAWPGTGGRHPSESMVAMAWITHPIEGHMSGKDYLIPCLHSHKPIDLVIILLGTNDLKHRFGVTAFDIAEGISHLVKMIQQSGSGHGGRSPVILILIPPPLEKLSKFAEMFAGGVEKSENLSQQYKRVAELLACPYLDTSEHIVSSDVDGVHFDASTHHILGQVVAQQVEAILAV